MIEDRAARTGGKKAETQSDASLMKLGDILELLKC